MHASKHTVPTAPAQTRNESRPLAGSVFSGEARLRELQHLAETARKVRDQAAAELTRNGSTHHIARDRIAAAERMLRKTQQEIAELRALLGPAVQVPAAPATRRNDFELAVLLGHSPTRFNQGDSAQPSLQLQDTASRGSHVVGTGHKPMARAKTGARSRFSWRPLMFGLVVGLGIAAGAISAFLALADDSTSAAVRDGTAEAITKLRDAWSGLASSAGALYARDASIAAGPAASRAARLSSSHTPDRLQEEQVRSAAEQRLARQIASQQDKEPRS